MAKKCPPGVFCVENMTMVFIILICVLAIYLGTTTFSLFKNENKNTLPRENEKEMVLNVPESSFFLKQNNLFSNAPNDVFMNPYNPPLKVNPFYNPTHIPDVRGRVPINIPTSHYDMNYNQVGIATRNDGTETILPIFGRPLHANRNKWQYYTMTGNNNIKLPVSKNGRSCTDTIGCDELYNGDGVYVEGYKDTFNVTIYDNSEPRYIPYL
jgi:hypothetical protein